MTSYSGRPADGKERSIVDFYHTGSHFPAISITGPGCALSCRHCMRKMIERLEPATTPVVLEEKCRKLAKDGVNGVLITGGCDTHGRVPLGDFLDTIKRIKEETGLVIAAHTGIVDRSEAKAVGESGIDCVCLDVVGSVETTRGIYGIEIPDEEYSNTLKALAASGIPSVAPHVCVGLHNGRLFHEFAALDIISCIKPANIVIIGLMGLVGTPMENLGASPADVMSVIGRARERFPESRVTLGCARGKGDSRAEIEKMALRSGVDGIAVPSMAAYEEASKIGLAVREHRACCALLPSQLEGR